MPQAQRAVRGVQGHLHDAAHRLVGVDVAQRHAGDGRLCVFSHVHNRDVNDDVAELVAVARHLVQRGPGHRQHRRVVDRRHAHEHLARGGRGRRAARHEQRRLARGECLRACVVGAGLAVVRRDRDDVEAVREAVPVERGAVHHGRERVVDVHKRALERLRAVAVAVAVDVGDGVCDAADRDDAGVDGDGHAHARVVGDVPLVDADARDGRRVVLVAREGRAALQQPCMVDDVDGRFAAAAHKARRRGAAHRGV
mmetsp:Transcript_17332/g.60973  ORF Transcript_17332/g.60973 Transcript_17332/m.60973 type:complete len:254 (-) Transcript_17332:385-1146(-)